MRDSSSHRVFTDAIGKPPAKWAAAMQKLLLSIIAAAGMAAAAAAEPVLPYPIMFVTQTPQPGDFVTIGALFGNHRGSVDSAPRGGGLWIRYEDGTLRNLTAEAGFGLVGSQDTSGIAVREPAIHWNGTKAIFSMVIGAPTKRYEVASFYWQLYEVTNFGKNQTPVITKVPNQPANYNNVAPVYGSDDRIIFASDRPRDGNRHLYPQLDEYEEAAVVSGLWSLNPATGDLFMLNHSPSGAFSPIVDSFGRVIFSRWDHLQRDQQADADNAAGGNGQYGTFNYSDETAGALILTNNRAEVFPEPRAANGTNNAHTFNHFFPWQINQDGTEEETLNHIGRHELGGSYRSVSFNNDSNLRELYYFGNKPNTNVITNFIHPRESVTEPGLLYGIDAPEFGTHSGGQVIAIEGNPAINPDLMKVFYVTHRATSSTDDTPDANHTGLYRNPLPLADGRLTAIHTAETRPDRNEGTGQAPLSRYEFRLKLLKKMGQYFQPDVPLAPGFNITASWWSPDVRVTYTGPMWELDPIEVRPRTRPAAHTAPIPAPEAAVFAQEGVDLLAFRSYLRQRDLALIVSRDVTGRDAGDEQQPYNLRVPGGKQTVGASGKIYDVQYLQMFQADQLRGIGLRNSAPRAGRRVLPQLMHDPLTDNVPVTDNPSAPASSVKIALDGSVAAIVPARRAMTWQTTTPNGQPVVRERYWVTFQPGEIRSCANCHGVNRENQAGKVASTNPPEALRELLRHWKENNTVKVSGKVEGQQVFPTVTFKRQVAAGLKYRVDVSNDLSSWVRGSEYNQTGGVSHHGPLVETSRVPGSHEAITLRDSAPMNPASRRFYRLITEKP